MKKKLGILMIFLVFACTGCVQDTIELTEEENNMAAEYIAGILLQHDIRYDKKLMVSEGSITKTETEEENETNPTKTPEKSPQPEASVAQSQSPQQTTEPSYVSVSEIYKEYGGQVNYKGKKESNSYGDIEAGKGKKLLVYRFEIKNKKSTPVNFSLIQSGITCRLETGSGSMIQPMLTILPNDLQYIDKVIQGGASTQAVLVFRVLETTKAKDCTLYISNQDSKAKVG